MTLRLLSNGVYIITSRDGDHFGAATVTWLSQASFKPPLLMAAIRPESNVFRCLTHSCVAAIHIVDCSQKSIAQRFFTPTSVAPGTINGEPYQDGRTSAPILQNFGAHESVACGASSKEKAITLSFLWKFSTLNVVRP